MFSVARTPQQFTRSKYQDLTGGREFYGTRAALEERHAQRLLELPNPLAQWWLRHVQPLRRTPEMQFLGDRNEVGQEIER